MSGNGCGAAAGGGTERESGRSRGEGRGRRLAARAVADVAVAALALLIGFGVFAFIGRDDSSDEPARNDPEAFTASSAATLPPLDRPVQPAVDGGAPTAREAIEGYLQAEVARDFTSSYLFLSSADRTVYRNAVKWESVQADRPTITGYRLESINPAADGQSAEATSSLDLVPVLDEVVGLVPAHATATWVAVQEGDVWRVSLEQSSMQPTWPSDATAAAAVEDWAEARQDCRSGEAVGEFAGGVLGSPAVADALCESEGAVRVGDPQPLDGTDGAPVFAAFGAEAQAWARVVEVSDPTPLRAVVAPLGDTWLVVAVLPAPS